MTLEQGTFNADLANPGQEFGVLWKDINPEEPHAGCGGQGSSALQPARGAYFAGGAFWFDDTKGGEGRLGQVFRYLQPPDLSFSTRAPRPTNMESPDNIVGGALGELWFAEDGHGSGPHHGRLVRWTGVSLSPATD